MSTLRKKSVIRTPALKIAPVPPEAEPAARLGLRLRHARLTAGLRLRELAEASACSESLISKIENNRVTPSLNMVHRLAKALGTTVAMLLSDPSGLDGMIMRRGERPKLSTLGLAGREIDGCETELLIPYGAETALQGSLIRIFPGGRNDGLRQHAGDEMGYVLSGEIALTLGEETHRLKAGDAFFFPSTRPHGIANPGEAPAEIIWVNTPPTL